MSENELELLKPHLSGEEQKYLMRAFDENKLSNFGSNIDEFNQRLTDYFGNGSHVALVNSGTSALHLALTVLGVGYGDEVLCQSFTFCASANPILYNGAIPIFVDSEDQTWNMSPHYLEEAIQDRIAKRNKPKAIIVVDTYGMPAKWEEIKTIARRYDIPIIEDAAEALGAEYSGRKCGSFGDIGVISFNSNKIITTAGGGALVSQNKDYIEKAKFLASQAKEKSSHYLHKELGFNYAMSNITAGMGVAQIKILDERLHQKKSIHSYYANVLKSIEGVELFVEPDAEYRSNHWLNCILIHEDVLGMSNLKLRTILSNQNIETRLLWYPMHMNPIFKDAPYYGGSISESLFSAGLCLPSSTTLAHQDLDRISDVFMETCSR